MAAEAEKQLWRTVLEASAGVLLAASIVWVSQTLVAHSERLAVAEKVLSERPPKWLTDRILHIEQEQKRLQRQIDRIEDSIPGIRGESLPPYSMNGPREPSKEG